jgi:hypothetical protein
MNPLLENIQKNTAAKVNELQNDLPDLVNEFNRVVVAGQKLMTDKNVNSHLEMVKDAKNRNDPVNMIAKDVSRLMWIVYMKSNKTIRHPVLVFAGTILMCEEFDIMERGYGLQITNDLVARTLEKLAEVMMTLLGITPEILAKKIQEGKQEIDDYKSGKLKPEDIKSRMQQQEEPLPPPTGAQ